MEHTNRLPYKTGFVVSPRHKDEASKTSARTHLDVARTPVHLGALGPSRISAETETKVMRQALPSEADPPKIAASTHTTRVPAVFTDSTPSMVLPPAHHGSFATPGFGTGHWWITGGLVQCVASFRNANEHGLQLPCLTENILMCTVWEYDGDRCRFLDVMPVLQDRRRLNLVVPGDHDHLVPWRAPCMYHVECLLLPIST